MDIVALVTGFVNLMWAPLTRQVQYLRNIEENSEILRDNIEELSGRMNDIRLEIDKAMTLLGKKPKNEVQIWLRNVEKVTVEVQNKIEKELQRQGRCMKGCFPNCNSRLKLGKLIDRKIKDIVELQRKGGFPNGLFVDALLDRKGSSIPTTKLVGETVGRILEMIWDCLMDTEITTIGIYGMGGVGKTTIMMHINNQLNEAQVFDNVIWVTVSKALNLEKLQHDIARAIDLDLSDDEDAITRATKLFGDLLRKKRFVLILDDLWCKFPLEKVGIPQPNKDNGCKLVFTTRLMEVCRGMETQREIKVEVLSKHEAWELFNAKVGGTDAVKLSPEIETIAKQITEQCGGLPLAIITVGRAMRRVDNIRIWRNALEELKNSKAEIEGMEDDVFARLKFSYNHLKNDRIRACLLYCALYPEDYRIDIEELIEYWMAEGFIDEVADREKEIDKGHSVLNELRDSCMLESVGTRWVKMHDLVRDLAISITREKNHLFAVKAGNGLKRIPEEWTDQEVERVSLMENSINMLSNHHTKWSKVSTLLLQRNPLSKSIQYSFFERMNSLKVLDLSDTNIELLPESISNLDSLRALFLRFCKLKKLPSLSKLKELRVLDVSYTRIKELPNDIEGMVNLRRIDLSYTERLMSFPTEVIPKFSHLENLSMFKSRWRWSSNKGGKEFEELMNASKLANLGLSFKNLRSFISYVNSKHWQVLRSYHLGIGLLSSFKPISKRNCSVEIQGCDLVTDGSLIVLPDNTLQLALQGCHDIKRLSKLPCISNLSELRECYVSRCNRMEYIVSAEDNVLLSLERLILRKLRNLMALCDGIATSCTLTRLKTLHIHGCDGLKNLFSLGLLRNLENLEEIEVWNSVLIEEVVLEAEPVGKAGNVIILPRLRRLYLSSLPELKSICRSSLISNSLDTIDIWNCRKLKKLPFEIDSIPFALKHLRGSKQWWDSLEWKDDTVKTLLLPFFKEDQQEDEDENHEDNTDIEEVEERDEEGTDGVNKEDDEYEDETDDEYFENAR